MESIRSSIASPGRIHAEGVMFIIPGQDLAADRAFFECVDRLEDLVERVGVGGGERTAAGELGQPLEQGKIGAYAPRPWPGPVHRIDAAGDPVRAGRSRSCAGSHLGRGPGRPPPRDRADGEHPARCCRRSRARGLFSWGAHPAGPRDHGDRIADIGAVVHRPRRAHRGDGLDQERVVEDRRACQLGVSWRRRPGRSGHRIALRQSA